METPIHKLTPDQVAARSARVIETRIREELYGEGRLKVYEHYVDGALIAETFTLESLAWCLGLPMSTVEGRYKRAKLTRWVVPVPSMAGRPMRGFPYQLLDHVVHALMHPNTVVIRDESGSSLKVNTRKQLAELVPEYYLGERYYTVAALAHSFGLSETTVRNKLNAAGLMRRFQNLAAPPQGGRPKRGIHERHLADVKLVLDGTVRFATKYEMSLRRATGELQEARREVRAAIVPHTPPAPNGLQAWDSFELAPVTKTPVNAVYSTAPGTTGRGLDDLDELMADIEAIASRAQASTQGPAAGEPAASAPSQSERSIADGTLDHYPTEREVRELEEEEAAANRRALIEPHIELLIKDKDEPTEEDLDDTCYALDLTGDAAEAFKRRVREGRAARKQTLGA